MPNTAISVDDMLVSGGGGRNIYGTADIIPEGLTVEQVMERADLNYNVIRVPLKFADGTDVPKFTALVRDDEPHNPWGMVTGRYQIAQNNDAFKVVDYMTEQGVTVQAAGKIGTGRKAWMMLRLPEDIVAAGDVIHPNMLVWNTHDGTGSLALANTPVRLSCTNMLPFLIHGVEQSYKIRHTGDILAKMEQASAALGVANDYFAEFTRTADLLAAKTLGDRALTRLLKDLYPEGTTDTTKANAEERRAAVRTVMETSENLEGHRGTAWAFVNAVGEIADWSSARSRDRIDRMTYNSPDIVIKNRAFSLVMN